MPGPSDRSYGIEVARLAGVPGRVVQRAKEVLSDLEKKAGDARRQTPGQTASRDALPGLESPCRNRPEKALQEHPLLKELEKLPLDSLTPLEALNILGEFKRRFGREHNTQGE